MEINAQYNSKDTEGKISKLWQDNGVFNAEVSDKIPYTIMIPPPNITGILHMGHALNNTIQDVLIRYKRMKGFEVLWMPGTDHAGIATQNVVEKQLAKEGLGKEDLGREAFVKRLWDWRRDYGSTILNQLEKLGASCDWRRTRFTMDEAYSDAVKEVFVHLYDKGLIYRGNYIINWCPRCKTALSDEEAAHREIDGFLYYIKYPVQKNKSSDKDFVVVATTRPETMLGDTGLAINPNDQKNSWLKDATVVLPIMNRTLKVVVDEAIDPEFGTGIVKVTPAHDPVDFILGKKHRLDFINIMGPDAVLNDAAGEFSGMDRFKARKLLLERLDREGLLLKKEPYLISAGHCYRCDTIVEPRLSLQWFVKMKPLAKEACRVVEEDKVTFSPQRWKKVYLNWMYNIQDWCISRQIWWGHRLPVYYCTDCQAKADDDHRGIIVSKTQPEVCPECQSNRVYQDPDVLDTWFSSWLWPFATFGWPLSDDLKKNEKELAFFYPTDCLVTASEILFFWVARMIMSGLEFQGQAPFKDVIIHGTVRDEKGVKMSKSLGNTIDPLEIIDKFGSDSLRFSLMLLCAGGADVYLSDDKFLVGRNFCNKIWNAARFLLTKIESDGIAIDNLDMSLHNPVDAWIVNKLNLTIEIVSAHLEAYRFNDSAKALYEFFWHDFCDWYIEISKDRFNENTAKILIHCLISSLKLLHPFIPFITEEIFQLIKANSKLVIEPYITTATWPVAVKIDSSAEDICRIEELIATVRQIRNIKVDTGLGLAKVKLNVSAGDHLDFWKENQSWFERLANLSQIEYKDKLQRTIYNNGSWLLNFDVESIDSQALVASLDKKVKKLSNVLATIGQRLNNQKFISLAPKETVEQEKNKYNDLNSEVSRLKELYDAFK